MQLISDRISQEAFSGFPIKLLNSKNLQIPDVQGTKGIPGTYIIIFIHIIVMHNSNSNSDNPRIVCTNLGFDLCAHNSRIVQRAARSIVFQTNLGSTRDQPGMPTASATAASLLPFLRCPPAAVVSLRSLRATQLP